MDFTCLSADELRDTLVKITLEWERRYGVAPAITSAISEYDAARLVGHTADSFALDGVGRTAVTRGMDFQFEGLRYQVKACRPSGKPGSKITKVPKASNHEWDLLVWILYDREFRVLEAWEWTVEAYRTTFHTRDRLSPSMMQAGRAIPFDSRLPVRAPTLQSTAEMGNPLPVISDAPLQKGTFMFESGREYTRNEIHAHVGGSKQSYLPTKNGAVVAGCLTHDLNPRAPHVILCGRGARIEPAGKLLATQPDAIPVFLKRGTNRWKYQGLFKPVASYTSGVEFDNYVAGSGRPPAEVSRVVVLNAASISSCCAQVPENQ